MVDKQSRIEQKTLKIFGAKTYDCLFGKCYNTLPCMEAELDLQKQKRAKEYARLSRQLLIINLAIGAIYILAWLVFGWSPSLKQWLLQLTTNEWLLVFLFGFVFGGIYLLINLPLSYYEEFVLPHRYQMSNQTVSDWILDQVKGLVVGGIIGAMMLEIIYFVLRIAPDVWWLYASVILLVFSVLLANLAPILLMPIFNKFVPLSDEHGDLVERLKRLAENANAKVQGVYAFDMSRRTKAANAALTGLGSTRRIILGDTLINEFSPDEIETVLAHELGHHVNRDIPILIVTQSILTVVGLYLASLGLKWGVAALGFQGPDDIAALPLFLLVMGAYSLITMPLGNAVSRWRERMADEYALKATGKAKAYASALTRLANQNLADADPAPWEEWLLYSHPALRKRIRMAEARAKE